MLARLRHSTLRPAVAAIFAVAMLALGFAHVAAKSVADPVGAVAAIALPDGTLAPICGGTGDPAHHHGARICDACQLTAAPGAIPAPPPLVEARGASARLPMVLALVSTAAAPELTPQSRGPPIL